MKKLKISMGIVLGVLLLLAPTAVLASAPVNPEYKMSVVAEPATVAPGETFEVRVTVDSPAAVGGLRSAEFKEFHFDHTLMEMVSMRGATESGEPWFGATFFTAPEDQIDEANATGTLSFPIGGVFWTAPPGPTPYGEIKFVFIEMKALPGTVGTHTVPLAVDVFFMQNALLEVITDPYIEGIPGEVVIEGPPPLEPDLTVPAVTTDWVVTGETYTVTFTIENVGGAAPPSTAAIYIDGVVEATADIPALAAGATHEVTSEVITLTVGRDTIKVYADHGRVVNELCELNNRKDEEIIRVDFPDLIVSDLEYYWIRVVPGVRYRATFTIKNQGDVPAPPSTASLKIDGVEVASFDIPELAPGETDTVREDVRGRDVPIITLTEGEDTIKVIADNLKVVAEADELNNYRELTVAPEPVQVAPPMPDLVVIPEDWSVEWVERGQYKVTFTIKNRGDADAVASTAGIKIDGQEKDTADVPALPAGQRHTATAGPFTITDGRDIVRVIADTDNVVQETPVEEGNNVREWAVEGQEAPWEAPWAIIAGLIGAVVVVGIVVFAVRRRTT